ncbi:ABC transporter ATP-binding protein [Lewinella sp. 4G2]|uniref:ABC transporter ATP-binding protein n=1 Tax=Lewinella sp. 4G2 TaxID=1803372 RepID=UPI0007B4D15F|nr:ABC transporter ATP-binding protein [Lewinella sp. 4G2]
MVAVLDGIGLAMFIPLLQKIAAPTADAGANLGKLAMVVEWLEGVGVDFNLTGVLLVILGFFTAKGIIRFLVQYYEVQLNKRFAKRLRNINVDLLAGYSYLDFAKMDAGALQNSFNAEVLRIHQAYQQYFVALKNAAMAVVYVILAYLANPGFALLVILLGVVASFLFKNLYRLSKRASGEITAAMSNLQGLLIQSINNFKYLKATDLINQYKDHLKGAILNLETQQRKVGLVNAISAGVREPLVIGLVVFAILVQVKYFGAPFGELVLGLLFFYRGLNNVVSVQNSYGVFLGLSGSIDGMQALSLKLREGQEAKGGSTFQSTGSGIQLRQLQFAFKDEQVLENLTLNIEAKSSLGIVGESGVGKTTLANVLAGLYPVAPGQLFVGGQDLTEVDLASYRRKVGYVTQEPPIFSDSLFNNVSCWDVDSTATREQVWRALELANAAGFVRELPKELDEEIGINGLQLSGGQRQRLAIAREVYRNVELLLLDEATSALDTNSEEIVRENLRGLAGQFTTVVVAHRLATVREADQILFLEPGGGYQIGTFAALLETSAGFRELARLQTDS